VGFVYLNRLWTEHCTTIWPVANKHPPKLTVTLYSIPQGTIRSIEKFRIPGIINPGATVLMAIEVIVELPRLNGY
jgi:hypothetical protein